MAHCRRLAGPAVAMVLASTPAAHAAHPLETEDTGTQGTGNVEIENGLSWTRADGASSFVYQPQVSYGLLPNFDLLVQPSWLRSGQPGDSTLHGFGDTNLDVKWRFYGSAPWSLGIRAGAELPTAQHGLGLPAGKFSLHELLVATYDAAPFTVHSNLGLTQNPGGSGQRSDIVHVSSALMWAVNERLILTVDGGAGANPDPSRSAWPATLLEGLIYTIQPGLDIDVGYHANVGSTDPNHEWLAGLTYRFAP